MTDFRTRFLIAVGLTLTGALAFAADEPTNPTNTFSTPGYPAALQPRGGMVQPGQNTAPNLPNSQRPGQYPIVNAPRPGKLAKHLKKTKKQTASILPMVVGGKNE